MIFMIDSEFIERRKKYSLACIEDLNDYNSLNCLYHMVKNLMTHYMEAYLKHIPFYDQDDYYQVGIITLWRVLQRAYKEPSIVDNFTNYFIVSLKNAYAQEFKKFVLSNIRIAATWEREGEGYLTGRLVGYEEYRQKIIEKKKISNRKYRLANKDKVNECHRKYYQAHKKELIEKKNTPEAKEATRMRCKKW